MGLVESAIAHRVSHFQGLPFFLDLIESRVHREDVNVVMGVGNPVDRPALAVNKLCIDHVWANATALTRIDPHSPGKTEPLCRGVGRRFFFWSVSICAGNWV